MIPREGSPLPEPDRRYWRRKVNRHVRRTRRTRTLLRWGGVALANAAVAGVLVSVGAGAVRRLSTSEDLAFETVEVEGAVHATPEAIRRTLERLRGQNLLGLSLDEVARRVESHPWVLRAEVKRSLPHTLRVTVTERTPAALAVVSGLAHVVDESGYVMGAAGPGLAYDLPVLTGLDRHEGAALAAALARGVEALRTLQEARGGLASRISELDLSAPDLLAVTLLEPGPTLLLDPEDVTRNLDLYLARGPEVARKVGPLRSLDLRWGGRFVVVPATGPATEGSD